MAIWQFAKRLAVLSILAVSILAVSVAGSHYIQSYQSKAWPIDSSWAQAIGSVLAILAGFVGVFYQAGRAKSDAQALSAERGRAAHLIAYDALETLTERLEAILVGSRPYQTHRLRGERTNEMVTAMREFDTASIPATMLADFIRLRSRVYAINQRINEIYRSEGLFRNGGANRDKADRNRRLNSAVIVWRDAVGFFNNLDASAQVLGGDAKSLNKPNSILNYTYCGD